MLEVIKNNYDWMIEVDVEGSVNEDDMLIINFVDMYTGEIIQRKFSVDQLMKRLLTKGQRRRIGV
jgi:hypothetical protein